MNKKYKISGIIVAILLVILAIAKPEMVTDIFQLVNSNQENVQPEISNEETSQPETSSQEIEQQVQSINYTFRNESYRNQHFAKHGSEFFYTTAEEYERGANRVIETEGVLHKKEAEDNDDVYYLEETNEFVIVSTDGYLRTYFKPNDGIDYYNRQ